MKLSDILLTQRTRFAARCEGETVATFDMLNVPRVGEYIVTPSFTYLIKEIYWTSDSISEDYNSFVTAIVERVLDVGFTP